MLIGLSGSRHFKGHEPTPIFRDCRFQVHGNAPVFSGNIETLAVPVAGRTIHADTAVNGLAVYVAACVLQAVAAIHGMEHNGPFHAGY